MNIFVRLLKGKLIGVKVICNNYLELKFTKENLIDLAHSNKLFPSKSPKVSETQIPKQGIFLDLAISKEGYKVLLLDNNLLCLLK